MNGGAHLSHRVMVRGFEQTPFLFEPRNPPYYPRLFEAHGFLRARTWLSYDMERPAWRTTRDSLEAVAARSTHRAELADPRDARVLDRIHALLDRVWAGHVGYAPFDREELEERYSGLLALMSLRDLGFVVDNDGRDVGFMLVYPDWVDEVRALAGDHRSWGAWLAEGRRPERVVLHTVAVLPEVRKSGAAYRGMQLLVSNGYEDGYPRAVVALCDEAFRGFDRLLPSTREHVLYARAL
jgi:hypothetical protein